jgi:hypothetical protein
VATTGDCTGPGSSRSHRPSPPTVPFEDAGGPPAAPALRQCSAVATLWRRLGALTFEAVAVTAVSAATLLVVAAFAVAAFTGSVRLSQVVAAGTFLLIVAAGLYASRLGAPGRSA